MKHIEKYENIWEIMENRLLKNEEKYENMEQMKHIGNYGKQNIEK